MLSAKDHVSTPFVVMYADDYCGRHAFSLCADFLSNECNDTCSALLGFALKNTLSPYGSVNRGECFLDDDAYLQETHERLKIEKK